MIPPYKILALKVGLETDIKDLEKRAQSVVTTQEYNNIQILIGEKENMVQKLTKLLC